MAPVPEGAMRPAVEYTVRLGDGRAHLVAVECRLRSLPPRVSVDFVLPVWTPGSYLVREFAQHVQDVSATDGGSRPLDCRKIEKNVWRVATGGAPEVAFAYRVYAYEASVRTSWLDGRHATLNGATLFVYADGFAESGATVTLELPPGWTAVSTSLERVAGAPGHVFEAAGFDELADSPIEAGTHEVHAFEACGAPHEIALVGGGNADPRRLVADVRRIVETAGALFGGGLPYGRYVFIAHLVPPGAGGGGLEHRASCLLQMPRFGFRPENEYLRRLSLVAHEFFHAWNVKRFRPRDFVPLDYRRENLTRLLWVAEGWTSYYEWVLLRRAGLLTGHQMLDALARDARSLLETPGRFVQSLEDASFDAWIKYYRQNENSRNSQVSYYVKGAVAALVLDLLIRERSRGTRSLDDVVRALDEAARSPEYRGYDAAVVKAACARAAGSPLDDYFRTAIEGTGEIDLARALRPFGLEIAWAAEPAPRGAVERRGFLGVSVASEGGKLRVKSVLAGSPALRAGLAAGDEIVAIDGWRVADPAALRARLEDSEAGRSIEIDAFHRDARYRATATLGEPPRGELVFRRVARPTPEQRTLYEQWIGEPFDREPTQEELLSPVGKGHGDRLV